MAERPILFSGEMVKAILSDRKTQTRRLLTPQPVSNGIKYSRELGDILCHCEYLPPSALLWQRGSKRDPYYLSDLEGDDWTAHCPFGLVGDRLWVRETWAAHPLDESEPPERLLYRADGCNYGASEFGRGVVRGPASLDGEGGRDTSGHWAPKRWRPSIHMPRWASRLTLEITDVRVERLQDISKEDAQAEGIELDIADQALVAPNYLDEGAIFQDWTEEEPYYAPMHRIAIESYRSLWDSLNAQRAPWSSNPWVWVLSFRRVESANQEAAQ